MHSGTIIKSTGSWFTVQNENLDTVNCKIKGNFKLKGIDSTNPLAVGDKVDYEMAENESVGLIFHIHPRRNYIIRKSNKLSKQTQIIASNIDRLYIVASLVSPRTSVGFIDRFLLTATAYDIPSTIIFNKTDLYTDAVEEFYERLLSIYSAIGVNTLRMSTQDPEGLHKLLETMPKDSVNLFSGLSGAGKSTLLNRLDPKLDLKTASISKQHQKGVHTTTFAEMYRLANGAYIIDTPGIRDFGIVHIESGEISHYFPEMRALINDCQFNNCKHIYEPGCAVKLAVEEGKIHPWRYHSYVSILNNEDTYT